MTQLASRRTPEEEELERKQAELAGLQADLAQRELDLATLQAELQAFELRYLRTVGAKLAQLDELEARIAELVVKLQPQDHQAQEQAQRARAQARQSAQASDAARESEDADRFEAPAALKSLYRDVAKHIHPDLTTDQAERERRTRVMAEANAAYERGDAEALEGILRQWQSSPEGVKGEGIGAELIRTIRKLTQVRERLAAIESTIAELKASPLYSLKSRVDEAQALGRDLLAEMAADLDGQIAERRQRLDLLKQREVFHER